MTRVKIINQKQLPLDTQKLLRHVKDRTAVVVDRYTHPVHGYEVLHVQLEPSGWGLKLRPGTYEVLS